MKTTFISLTIIICLLFSVSFLSAQSNKLKLNLDGSGKNYIKASIRMQLWARYFDTNPGSTINGENTPNIIDFSMRRLRMEVSSQVNSKLFVYTLFGGNNLNEKTEKEFQFKILDLFAEYEFSKEFALGLGKSGWEGLSRWNVRSSGSLMTLDAPIFSLLTINKNDDEGRSLGIWAKGQFGKFDYTLAFKSPAQYGVQPTEGKVDYSLNKPRKRTSAYVKYQFLDKESNKNPYSGRAGTYLGKKNVFNIGAGFMYQPKMTAQLVNGIKNYYDFKNWAVDVFYDVALNKEKGTAITSYLGYFNTNFGPNYIRNVGANNITSGGTSFNESGNSFPMIGTGNTLFFQLGYLFQKFKKTYQLQPNFAVQYSNFDALNNTMIVYDFGVNCYFKEHNNKLSLNYQNRPIFQNVNNQTVVTEHKGMIVLQYQIAIN